MGKRYLFSPKEIDDTLNKFQSEVYLALWKDKDYRCTCMEQHDETENCIPFMRLSRAIDVLMGKHEDVREHFNYFTITYPNFGEQFYKSIHEFQEHLGMECKMVDKALMFSMLKLILNMLSHHFFMVNAQKVEENKKKRRSVMQEEEEVLNQPVPFSLTQLFDPDYVYATPQRETKEQEVPNPPKLRRILKRTWE